MKEIHYSWGHSLYTTGVFPVRKWTGGRQYAVRYVHTSTLCVDLQISCQSFYRMQRGTVLYRTSASDT